MRISPKKSLGQHFLHNIAIAQQIVASLQAQQGQVLEIGPGTGALTQWLLPIYLNRLFLVEIDETLVKHLLEKYPALQGHILHQDFLLLDLSKVSNAPLHIIGNFPYNISSQIFFKIFHCKDGVESVVCMIQEEVAARIVGTSGKRTYGILSVLLQTYYSIEYLFKVPPQAFNPPPQVQSAVIRLTRNNRESLTDEKKLVSVVKSAFQQRRKKLSNALKHCEISPQCPFLHLRAEQLSVENFIELISYIHFL